MLIFPVFLFSAKTDLESYSFPSKDKEIASTVSSHTACKDKIKRRWQFWKCKL